MEGFVLEYGRCVELVNIPGIMTRILEVELLYENQYMRLVYDDFSYLSEPEGDCLKGFKSGVKMQNKSIAQSFARAVC